GKVRSPNPDLCGWFPTNAVVRFCFSYVWHTFSCKSIQKDVWYAGQSDPGHPQTFGAKLKQS
ncbi:uncharacterized protein METZ01_LOCUS251869, partial [marine metagenome]